MNTKKLFARSLLATALVSSLSFAATDGALSPFETSANLSMQANVQSLISITHVDDVTFGSMGPGVNVFGGETYTQTESICVYTNSDTFELEIDALNSNPTDGFRAEGLGRFGLLPFRIDLREGEFNAGVYTYTDYAVDVTPNQVVGNLSYDTNYYQDEDCNSSTSLQENIQVVFVLQGDDVVNARPDNYVGEVTITARTTTGEFLD
jgi:hypothetical protein